MTRLSKIYAALFAYAAVALASGAAHAFTFQNGDGGSGSSFAPAPSPFNSPDPDKKFDSKPGTNKYEFGNTSVYIGSGNGRAAVERDFNTGMDRMFSPLGRPPN